MLDYKGKEGDRICFFSTRGINFTSFIITALMFTLLSPFSFVFSKVKVSDNSKSNINISSTYASKVDSTSKNVKEKSEENNKNMTAISMTWRLKIDAIDLNAEIAEGTDQKTLSKYIGHFEGTERKNGNIGLAAHNRGYSVNYFAKIKNLKKGDKIEYFYKGKKYTYEVYKNFIIKDTDWSEVENDEKDKITLITCVENRPEVRRCIKGKLIK